MDIPVTVREAPIRVHILMTFLNESTSQLRPFLSHAILTARHILPLHLRLPLLNPDHQPRRFNPLQATRSSVAAIHAPLQSTEPGKNPLHTTFVHPNLLSTFAR